VVGVESLGTDLLEWGEEFADAAVVVDPALSVLGLVVGEVATGGFVGDLAGPVPVGAVQAWRVVVAGAARFAAAGVSLGDRAGQYVGSARESGEFGGDLECFLALGGVELHRCECVSRGVGFRPSPTVDMPEDMVAACRVEPALSEVAQRAAVTVGR
jgi:hypothetical protein